MKHVTDIQRDQFFKKNNDDVIILIINCAMTMCCVEEFSLFTRGCYISLQASHKSGCLKIIKCNEVETRLRIKF